MFAQYQGRYYRLVPVEGETPPAGAVIQIKSGDLGQPPDDPSPSQSKTSNQPQGSPAPHQPPQNATPSTHTPLFSIPIEIRFLIADLLPPTTIIDLSTTCRKLRFEFGPSKASSTATAFWTSYLRARGHDLIMRLDVPAPEDIMDPFDKVLLIMSGGSIACMYCLTLENLQEYHRDDPSAQRRQRHVACAPCWQERYTEFYAFRRQFEEVTFDKREILSFTRARSPFRAGDWRTDPATPGYSPVTPHFSPTSPTASWSPPGDEFVSISIANAKAKALYGVPLEEALNPSFRLPWRYTHLLNRQNELKSTFVAGIDKLIGVYSSQPRFQKYHVLCPPEQFKNQIWKEMLEIIHQAFDNYHFQPWDSWRHAMESPNSALTTYSKGHPFFGHVLRAIKYEHAPEMERHKLDYEEEMRSLLGDEDDPEGEDFERAEEVVKCWIGSWLEKVNYDQGRLLRTRGPNRGPGGTVCLFCLRFGDSEFSEEDLVTANELPRYYEVLDRWSLSARRLPQSYSPTPRYRLNIGGSRRNQSGDNPHLGPSSPSYSPDLYEPAQEEETEEEAKARNFDPFDANQNVDWPEYNPYSPSTAVRIPLDKRVYSAHSLVFHLLKFHSREGYLDNSLGRSQWPDFKTIMEGAIFLPREWEGKVF